MRRLILIAAISALALAHPKPETYKETEDFQFSRSSSDHGTKSGFYGAQRGNMGGNYERAHNMDTLAQHQMSGLVSQVDGELGEGAKTRTGSVYTAANSRGIYGYGNYDLSNLQGRNFAEGESVGNSQSHSSLSSQSSNSDSRYRAHSYSGLDSSASSRSRVQDTRYSGHQTSRHADQTQIDNLQAADSLQGHGRHEGNSQADNNMKYQTQYGSRGQSEYDQSSGHFYNSNSNDANTQHRYIMTPVARVVVRPGGRVAIPLTAPTYPVSQSDLSVNNGMTRDVEVLSQQGGSIPTNKEKHYEASYSYRKQWEKHHAVPGDVSLNVPTENPFPKNSELYEDAQLLQSSKDQLQNANSLTAQSDNMNSQQRAYTKSASTRSRFNTGYNSQQSHSNFDSQQNQAGFNSQHNQLGLSTQQGYSGLSSQQSRSGLRSQQSQLGFNVQQGGASSDTYADTYGRSSQASRTATDLTNADAATGEDVDFKPKSYQSSYSYHKSWERQGDPYVIKPVGGTYDGQASERLTSASSNNAAYSSHQYGSHSRQAHQSYSADCDDQGHVRVARSTNTDQQQNQWEDLGQQTQDRLEKLEDFGQQTQGQLANLEDFGQQTQGQLENLEDLGQQQQQNKWDNLQELGQQTQNQWDNLQQLGQETQNQWGNLQQLGQQTQNQWDNLQQLGQQTQDKWDNLEELGQQTYKTEDIQQHQNENGEHFTQPSKRDDLTNFENQNENLDLFSQHSLEQNPLINVGQQANNQNENFKVINQNTQNEEVDILSQHNQKEDAITNFEQQSNGDFDVQFPSVIQNNRDLFDENQQNKWYETRPSDDENVNSYDFMKPVSQWTDNSENDWQRHDMNVNDNQNLYPISSSIFEHNHFWSQEQDSFWNTNHNQNTNYQHNYWHMDNFNNVNNKQSENNFFPTSSSTSNTEHPLLSIWDTIDNIAVRTTATESNTNDKKLFSHDYDWSYKPIKPANVDLVNTNTDEESKGYKSEHNNLFDEQTQTNITNANTTSIQQPNGKSHNLNSEDEGRGDIGPEETPLEMTTIDKPYKTSQEIETLSLTKETPIPKDTDVIIQPSSIKNTDENIDNKGLLLPNLSQQQNKPYELFTTVESNVTSTTPTIKTSTTEKSIINVYSEQSANQPILNVNNKPLPDLQQQVPYQETVQTVEIPAGLQQQHLEQQNLGIPADVQQQNLEQQNVEIPAGLQQQNLEQQNVEIPADLQQQNLEQQNVETPADLQQQNLEQQNEDFGQLQSSWFPTNLQQGYDQQNTAQQFEDFNQHESMQDTSNLQDFGQYIQSPSQSEQGNPSKYRDTENPITSQNYEQQFQPSPDTSDASSSQIRQPIHPSIHNTDSNSKETNLGDIHKNYNSQSDDIQSRVVTISEKTGFWNSLGKKITNAKNKVVSWFSSS